MKICTRCGKWKLLGDFYKCVRATDGHESQCKSCKDTYNREYYRTHTEEIKAYQREYYRSHSEEIRAYERVRREERRAYSRRYFRTEKGKRAIARGGHKRRARLLAAESDLTEEGMLELLATYKVCPYCGSEFKDGGGLVWDHIVPLSKGGADVLDNLLPVCAKCNASKGSKLLSEWEVTEMSEIARLVNWILANCPEEIGECNSIESEDAVAIDIAIKMMRECLAHRVTAAAGKPER